MPFDSKYKEVYEHVYKPVCEQHGIECYRIDERARPGSITKDIVEGIIDADIIIADLTSKNPNVFYELGFAHSISNKTIMTCQKSEELPFDIASYRVLFYEQSLQGGKDLSEILGNSISDLLDTLNQTNNPIQEVISQRSVINLHHKFPIFKLVNPKDLNANLLRMFESENIVYSDDLKKIDFARIKEKYALGKRSLEKLVKLVLDNNLYDGPKEIQRFILENKLNTNKTYKEISRGW